MDGTKFERGTAVEARGDGAYAASIGEEWNCPIVPHGGLVTATALRTMAAELDDPDQTLRSVTTVFAAQVQPGPVEIEVTMLRRGRSISQLSATARTPGADAGHTTLAVFGAERDGFEFTDAVPPEVPPPHECPSFRDPPPPGFEPHGKMNFWDYSRGGPRAGTRRGSRTSRPPRSDPLGIGGTSRRCSTTVVSIRSPSSRCATRCRDH